MNWHPDPCALAVGYVTLALVSAGRWLYLLARRTA